MIMKELKGKCREHIAKDELEEAIDLLLSDPILEKKYQNQLVGFKRRFSEISDTNVSDTISQEDISRRKSKLSDSILVFLKRLPDQGVGNELEPLADKRIELQPSFWKKAFEYLSDNLQKFRYILERLIIGLVYFIPGFYAAQTIFHKWGSYEIGYEWKFVALFAGVIGSVSLLMNAIVQMDFYRLSNIQLHPVQETLITVVTASAFLWISSWMPNPVPSGEPNTVTAFKAIDEILKTQEIRHPQLIEDELMKTENITLIQSGLRALSAYNKQDRALQALFTILRKRESMLVDQAFYQSMKSAIQSYEARAVGELNKLFLAYKDSIAILYSIPDSAVTPLSKYLSAEKLKLDSEQLNQDERAALERKIIAMEALLAIVYQSEANVANPSTEGKTLMLNFVVDVLNNIGVPPNNIQMYQQAKEILANEAYPVETRAMIVRFIARYQMPDDAEYFAKLLQYSKDNTIKIAALDAMTSLRSSRNQVKK